MRKAFTLVELLAVIVILAVILVIAIPKITDTITASKKSALESSTKVVASTLETNYQSALASGSTFATSGSCASYVDSNEYGSCTYTITDGVATVTLKGKSGGKFDGLKASGTKNDASIVDIPTLPTVKANFAAYTWNEIYALAYTASLGRITYSELSSTYNLAVGQTRTIDLGTLGTHTVRIANMSNGEDNTCETNGFSETACGFVVEFVDIIVKYTMNLTSTNIDGWESSTMRTYVNDTIYNALSSDLQSVISDTIVVSGHGSTTTETNFTTVDKLYLLSAREVWVDGTSNVVSELDTGYNYTRQLDYYKNNNITTNNFAGTIKQYNGSNTIWWLRAAYYINSSHFLGVYNSDGDWYAGGANKSRGVSPAFRIG